MNDEQMNDEQMNDDRMNDEQMKMNRNDTGYLRKDVQLCILPELCAREDVHPCVFTERKVFINLLNRKCL
jgi:hypothetical protein